jgi:hypothetical protein
MKIKGRISIINGVQGKAEIDISPEELARQLTDDEARELSLALMVEQEPKPTCEHSWEFTESTPVNSTYEHHIVYFCHKCGEYKTEPKPEQKYCECKSEVGLGNGYGICVQCRKPIRLMSEKKWNVCQHIACKTLTNGEKFCSKHNHEKCILQDEYGKCTLQCHSSECFGADKCEYARTEPIPAEKLEATWERDDVLKNNGMIEPKPEQIELLDVKGLDRNFAKIERIVDKLNTLIRAYNGRER